MPIASASRGAIRPAATGRSAVRTISRSMSRSYQWLIALEPPELRPMPTTVATSSQVPGQPCAAKPIAPTVVITSHSMIRGLRIST